jgi:hypothetical protein
MNNAYVRWIALLASISLGFLPAQPSMAQTKAQSPAGTGQCRIESGDYKGWQAQQMSNSWVRLTVVPENGGRMMQVNFAGHEYLFVNPKLAGKHMPPTQDHWFNYGGDKIWLLPEGNGDEQHWVGNSDLLDDGPFTFKKVSEGQHCEIELTSLPDPHTGIQITRSIRLDADSPRIAFHVNMKNISGHPLDWSMQSVSQYDTGSATDPAHGNRNFWAFTPANPSSSYLNRYHVRFGPAENPAASIREDGLFTVHYAHLAAELWVDSTEGWVALVDGTSHYAMVERFTYDEHNPYPGKASVIFWTNGPELRLNNDGVASVSGEPDGSPFYMEGEVNSPMCHLRPGQSCIFETEWFPTRAGDEFHGVKDPGLLIRPLSAASSASGKVKLSGSFGVFFPGKLVAYFYDAHGGSIGHVPLLQVSPADPVSLDMDASSEGQPARVSLHLEDETGLDRGTFGEVPITTTGGH